MKKIIRTSHAPTPIGPYNQAIYVNETLYVSGQIAIDPPSGKMIQTDLETEAKRVMDNIRAIIQDAGLGMEDIVKASIYITDIENFKKVNDIYSSYFKESYPAREVLGVCKLPLNANIMISVTAVASE